VKRSTLASCFVLLASQLAGGSPAHADELLDACDYVARQVSTFEGGLYRQVPDTFEDEGKIYRGCLVTVVGDRGRVPDGFPPAEAPYPKDGATGASALWRADRQADGPDGTSYRIMRGEVFCLVSGMWDGGDPTEASVVPSPLFLITARCARTQ
jgi:hypothetical protein